MKTCFTLLLFFGLLISSYSQSTFKNIPNTSYVKPQPIQVNPVLKAGINPNRIATGLSQNQLHSLRPSDPSVLQFRILSSGSFWIDMRANHLWQSRASISDVI